MEIWKDIEGYVGYYQVSNLGNVKSLPRLNAGPSTKLTERLLKQEKIVRDQTTYRRVTLSVDNDVRRFLVHQLVARAFIPNPLNKLMVNHDDFNGSNNRLDNLEWCTGKENMLHSALAGRQDRPRELGCKAASERSEAMIKAKIKRLLGGRYIRSYFIGRNRYAVYDCPKCSRTHLEATKTLIARGGPIIRRTPQCKVNDEGIV